MLTFDAEKGVIVRDYEEEYNSIISSERFYAREEGREEGYKIGFETGMKEAKEIIIEKCVPNMKASGLDDTTIMKLLNTDEATINRALAK